MRISTVLVIVIVAAGSGAAASTRVAVCTEGVVDGPTLSRATQEASEIFSKIGVKPEWRTTGSHCPERAILVTITDRTPGDLFRGALAVALPYEGTHIRVFYDRINAGDPAMRGHVLAHVLVHEIGHILQGVSRHSEEGVMKAVWSGADYNLMFRRRLNFMPADIELIQAGLGMREARRS